MIDTCQAASMFQKFYSPNILAVASSLVGEDSLSVSDRLLFFVIIELQIHWNISLQHHVDPAIGVYIIDRYTYYALEFLEKVTPDSKTTMEEFVRIYFVFDSSKDYWDWLYNCYLLAVESVPEASLHIDSGCKDGLVSTGIETCPYYKFLWIQSTNRIDHESD